MEFFKCSIGGVSYGAGITEIERNNAERCACGGLCDVQLRAAAALQAVMQRPPFVR
jgi:hypothetical protein